MVGPGSQKTGVALLDFAGKILEKKVCPNEELGDYIQKLDSIYTPDKWVFGNKGAGRAVCEQLREINLREVKIIMADEHRSSEEGRKLFWSENSPKGWKKILPTGLQTPDQPWDDWAAVVIGRRWLKICESDNQK